VIQSSQVWNLSYKNVYRPINEQFMFSIFLYLSLCLTFFQ
jgi:hypothetical protein